MTVAFTICANNYLAHAKTLAVSFKTQHPDIKFMIAILDEPNQKIDYNSLGADEVLWIPKLMPDLIDELKSVYGIAELCTVVKPELFKYFYNNGCEKLLYIDPDIKVFSKLNEVFEALDNSDIVLTPHICSPTGEIGHPLDKDLMRTGIYNLGFLAMNKTIETIAFVNWWDKRVKKYGYHDLQKGFFYDQIWLGYAPAFLDKVCVLRHLGYNMANWNLHERKIIKKGGKYFVNNGSIPLRFFHYSHFKMEALPSIASYNENYNLNNRPDIVPIYMEYKADLLNNQYMFFKNIDYSYGKRALEIMDNAPVNLESNRFIRSLALLKKAIKIIVKG